ncbi:hypothetical protein LTR49_013775 [Elasticomyces elasticus]|nr:hypothetical protein LTR49_013775 [Elasticomyces elasticus]
MCSVYENAYVTLAALDSPDTDHGLFLPSAARRVYQLTAPSMTEHSDELGIFVRQHSSGGSLGFIHQRARQSSSALRAEALEDRGWTMQELDLSPRTLWFSAHELAWTCRYGTACECEPTITTEYNLGSTAPIIGRKQLTSTLSSDLKANMQHWQTLVERFTARGLSVTSDRLPAIAGLARAFQRHTHDAYLSGL